MLAGDSGPCRRQLHPQSWDRERGGLRWRLQRKGLLVGAESPGTQQAGSGRMGGLQTGTKQSLECTPITR